MIEKLVTSKTRIKILELFLSNIDDRYYLRELERILDESLSPLRRQLVKLTRLGILIVEEEANLKYYKINKNFEGLEELRGLILRKDGIASNDTMSENLSTYQVDQMAHLAGGQGVARRVRFDLLLLSFISIFVLITAIFVVYANMKSIKQMASLIAKDTAFPTASVGQTIQPTQLEKSNGEMMSKKWKVMPGNVPVLSSGDTGEEKNSKEL